MLLSSVLVPLSDFSRTDLAYLQVFESKSVEVAADLVCGFPTADPGQ